MHLLDARMSFSWKQSRQSGLGLLEWLHRYMKRQATHLAPAISSHIVLYYESALQNSKKSQKQGESANQPPWPTTWHRVPTSWQRPPSRWKRLPTPWHRLPRSWQVFPKAWQGRPGGERALPVRGRAWPGPWWRGTGAGLSRANGPNSQLNRRKLQKIPKPRFARLEGLRFKH